MTYKAKDLSEDQKLAIESLLGRAIADNEEITILAALPAAAPAWLRESWDSAERQELDQLTMDEIDAEIDAARMARLGQERRSEQ